VRSSPCVDKKRRDANGIVHFVEAQDWTLGTICRLQHYWLSNNVFVHRLKASILCKMPEWMRLSGDGLAETICKVQLGSK
jgi:hypothetical protein